MNTVVKSIKQTRVVNSALWAAAGDALGWISELTDESGLSRRSGVTILEEPIEWTRRIGGMYGADVHLPAGSYSDDTQLRLATCRAIRGDGSFDVEAFAKVEFPVWSGYALGAGRGSKAAAANLAKRDVTWFSNFYVQRNGQPYERGGGNGAAMRIQPHVWCCSDLSQRTTYLRDVCRNAVVSHGHMLGICGAVFHADCVAFVLRTGSVPGPKEWSQFIDLLFEVPTIISDDDALSAFWVGTWEKRVGMTINVAVDQVVADAKSYLKFATKNCQFDIDGYTRFLDFMDGRGRMVGAGLNTALAAAFASWIMRGEGAAQTLRACANVLGSDTDTIATMAGAISGAASDSPPTWPIQDSNYIRFEALRMARIAELGDADSFTYPDLSKWRPPRSQKDIVGTSGGRSLAVKGLGFAVPLSEVRVATEKWLWVELSFGQSVLCKASEGREVSFAPSQLPGKRMETLKQKAVGTARSDIKDRAVELKNAGRVSVEMQSSLKFEGAATANVLRPRVNGERVRGIDELSEEIIRSNFDERVIGACLKECVQGAGGVEKAIALSAIVAKAILARNRRPQPSTKGGGGN